MSSLSSCTAHPTTEAVGRCKQCGKPFCGKCKVVGPTGNFCSESCLRSHEEFIARAKQLDDMKKSTPISARIRQLVTIFVAVLLAGVVAHYFGFDVPVISDQLGDVLPAR